MSQFTSTMIDDEDLIEELRKYGEPNLPSLPTASTTTSRRTRASSSTQLNDTNREIYLKKLNHYRAKEKAKTNPSKQYKKQQQATAYANANANVKQPLSSYAEKDEEQDDDDDDDVDDEVVEINSPNASQYVKVTTACTSPISNGTIYDFDDSNDRRQHLLGINNSHQTNYSHLPSTQMTAKLGKLRVFI